ncbi:MAG: hypothetical protein PUC21_03295 [Bacteroidales bacterium]|nr:hypothetical protein [Bacteroidales bacterium]
MRAEGTPLVAALPASIPPAKLVMKILNHQYIKISENVLLLNIINAQQK